MIPTRLNLLSSAKQQRIKNMIYMQTVTLLLQVVLIGVVLIAMAMLGSRAFLEVHFSQINSAPLNATKSFVGIKQQVTQANERIALVAAIQKQYHSFHTTLLEIISIIPNTIVLNSLTIQETNNTMTMSGLAQTRDDLLALQQSLEQLPFVSSVTFPTSLLSEREQIAFTFDIRLK